MRKCTNCNQTYSDNMKYCSSCGAALTEITEANGQVKNGYYAQNNDNVIYNTQQNYQNGENVYNPSNSYTGMPNQNNVEEDGIIPWLPLILSIMGLILGNIYVGLLFSIGAFVLLKMQNHIYKYSTAVKILSIVGIIYGGLACFSLA